MAEIEHIPIIVLPDTPAPLGTQARPQPRSQTNTGRNTPIGGGHNADEAIMIGSSDDEEEFVPAAPRRSPPRRAIQVQRARLHSNRHGTPIPRAPEDGMRIMSPPPPLPGAFDFGVLNDPRRIPRARDGTLPPAANLHERFMPNARQLRAERFQMLQILHQHRHPDIPFGSLLDILGFGRGQERPPPPPEEYNVRMTHASVKPRVGFTYDFAPDEEAEAAAAANPAEPQPRMRTTIVIPDSPPAQPVDRKGKGRMKEEDMEPEVLDLDDEDAPSTINLLSSPIAESSSQASSSAVRRPRRQPQRPAVGTHEIVELIEDDEAASPQEKAQTVLVCARCRQPLRTGGDRLWALRCGHMIDSSCYHKLAEPSTEMHANQELFPTILEDIPSTSSIPLRPTRASKRRRTGRNASGSKGKAAAPAPAAAAPRVVQTLKWKCPVTGCDKIHTSEHVVTGVESSWRPAQADGAIKVYI